RSTTSHGDLCFKAKLHWLSGVYSCLVGHLRLTAQTLVSVMSETYVCRLGHLPLSRQRIATVKQGEGGWSERHSSLLPDRRKPVHSGNIRLTGCSPSSSAKGTAYPEFRYLVDLEEKKIKYLILIKLLD
uniref:hypothetical protein n=1 Tax=Prevotella heparinolytica TaxID=28113 RepID=UPI0035A16C46